MQQLERILHGIDMLSEWSGKLLCFLIPVMVALLVIEQVARGFFNESIIWIYETVQFMFGTISILAGAYVLRYVAHVRMDLLYARLSPKGKAYLDLATAPFFFLFVAVVLWWGWQFALRSFVLGEYTQSVWAPPRWPIKMMIPLGAFLILLQGIVKLIRDSMTALGGEPR